MRGTDIDYNPVFFSYVLLTLDEIYLFVAVDQLPSNYVVHFSQNNVTVKVDNYENAKSVLEQLIAKTETQSKIWISSTSNYALIALVPEKRLHSDITPICLLKAIKNDVEAKGLADCHVRDGVALCKYFAWLEAAVQRGEPVDEISGANKLEEFRSLVL